MGCREAIYFEESTIDFPIFLLFFNTNFPIFPIRSKSWVSYIPIFFFSNHATDKESGIPQDLESGIHRWNPESENVFLYM